MVLTLISRPWGPGLIAPHRLRNHLATLASASGGQNHAILRPCRDRSSAHKRCDPTRPPYPALNARDDRKASRQRVRDAADNASDSRSPSSLFTKIRINSCDTWARRSICAWRMCKICPSCNRWKLGRVGRSVRSNAQDAWTETTPITLPRPHETVALS
jgi:hypothetical protein